MSENVKFIKIKFSTDKIAIIKSDAQDKSANLLKEAIKLELSVSRIFHKVLNKGRLTEIFEKNDFEVLGNVLYKIICSNQDAREFFLNGLKVVIRDKDARCRIFLEFDEQARDLAALPWEYLLIEEDADKNIPQFYLAADRNKQFDVIRLVPEQKEYIPPADLDKRKTLKVITVISNTLTRDLGVDEEKFIDRLLRLQKNYKVEFDDGEEEDRIDFFNISKPSDKGFVDSLNDAIKNVGNGPYILHFFGHAQLKDNKASIAFMDENEEAQWITSDDFAAYFADSAVLPEMIILQACESGQISPEGTGLAIDLVKKGIPVVVAMQNEVTEEISLVFIERLYDGIMNGLDIAEAVSRSRTYLGCEYKKNANQKDFYYCDNSFGTPVIFTSTPTPIRFMPKPAAAEGTTLLRKMKCPRCGKVYENPRTEICGWVACRGTRLQPYKDEVSLTTEMNRARTDQLVNSSAPPVSPSAPPSSQSGNNK